MRKNGITRHRKTYYPFGLFVQNVLFHALGYRRDCMSAQGMAVEGAGDVTRFIRTLKYRFF